MQSRNRVSVVENKFMVTKGRSGDGMNWEIGIDIYTLLMDLIKQTTNESPLYSSANSTQCSVVT